MLKLMLKSVERMSLTYLNLKLMSPFCPIIVVVNVFIQPFYLSLCVFTCCYSTWLPYKYMYLTIANGLSKVIYTDNNNN